MYVLYKKISRHATAYLVIERKWTEYKFWTYVVQLVQIEYNSSVFYFFLGLAGGATISTAPPSYSRDSEKMIRVQI